MNYNIAMISNQFVYKMGRFFSSVVFLRLFTGCFISICHFMITYILITLGDMKTKLFLLKTKESLRSKNLNTKIKEINVLLNFSQMFNMRDLD